MEKKASEMTLGERIKNLFFCKSETIKKLQVENADLKEQLVEADEERVVLREQLAEVEKAFEACETDSDAAYN